MIYNTQKILAMLKEGLDREKGILEKMRLGTYGDGSYDCQAIFRVKQEGVIAGIELTMSWIENNITQK